MGGSNAGWEMKQAEAMKKDGRESPCTVDGRLIEKGMRRQSRWREGKGEVCSWSTKMKMKMMKKSVSGPPPAQCADLFLPLFVSPPSAFGGADADVILPVGLRCQ